MSKTKEDLGRLKDLLRCVSGTTLKALATGTNLDIQVPTNEAGQVPKVLVVDGDTGQSLFAINVLYPNQDTAITDVQRLITAAEEKYFSHV
jgi:hypothetical protein